MGAVLAASRADSSFLADAHAVAAAVERGRAMVLAGDSDDLQRLAAAHPNVTVVGL
ncbi:hypothetical protein [Rhabdothermincola sediminis]|uniref:hypothetical protein n=1 Tax=Rhabdothermincola sediminis TaxID=2751370 RepID=UPI001AA09EBA|nr:hypothetical protein [Rhabdothermincola sediminis]